MIPRLLSPLRPIGAAALVLGATLAGGRVLPAQAVAGVGDDAIPLPTRGWRFTLSGLWNDYSSVFTASGGGGLRRQPLYGDFATSAAGVAQFPTLRNAETAIRALTGNASYQLSLGTLEVRGAVRQSLAPLAAEFGVTRRLSVRVVVPYAESRDATQFLLNRDGAATTLGVNPAYGSTGGTARATNGALLSEIDAARAALSAEIARCAVGTASGCDAVRGNPSGAQALLTRALAVRQALAALYGTGSAGGAPVVPVAGSPLHTAVSGTLTTLRSDFATLGVTALSANATPAAAVTVMGPGGGFPRVASDTSFGVGYARRGNTRRAGIGDIDLTATYLLVDTFGADQARRLREDRRAIRSTVTAGWRFGTAGADRTEDAFDVPIGEGASALLLRSTTDLVWSRRWWLSATVRAAQPIRDNLAVIVPYRDVAGLFAPVATAPAARSLGLRYDLEVAPRVAIGQFFGVSAAVLVRRWGADRYEAAPTAVADAASRVFVQPARTLQAASVGATFSTLASYLRGRSRFPAEVIYTHTEPLGASGGSVPAVATDRLELRLYKGFPRR